ncbi:KAP family P-loop NTPase fold protein [Candidatus Foliamicus sp.]
MGIRIKPFEIEVPPGDPFKYDALERKESVKIFARLIRLVEGPGVFGIDADWGYGKTTFIRMLHRHLELEEEKVPVVRFNAWESDYVSDPFTALATELMDGLKEHPKRPGAEVRKSIEKGRECARAVMRTRWPAMLQTILEQVPVAGTALREVADVILESYVDERVSAYRDARKSVEEFKSALSVMAQQVSGNPERPLLVVIIDELDRCRPSYAVELLEVAKHLFSVDGIVFVVAVNRTELAHSVRALYGPEFDARGYLGRFFDVDFRLPAPDRTKFIERTIGQVRIMAYLNRPGDPEGLGPLKPMLVAFFGGAAVSLRTTARAIHLLGMVYGALQDRQFAFGTTAAVLVILRTLNRELYDRFVEGRASDAEVVDGIVGLLEASARTKHKAMIRTFETWMITAHIEREQYRRNDNGRNGQSDTPLMQRYEEAVAEEGAPNNRATKTPSNAKEVLYWLKQIRGSKLGFRGIGFNETVQRIELLSPHLDEQPDSPSD